jgi:hypothetical protein
MIPMGYRIEQQIKIDSSPMTETNTQISRGDAIKVKGEVYLVFDIKENQIFCRKYRFTKTGRFQYYQDYTFAFNRCQLANQKEKQIINEQRIQASLQRKPYSPIADNYVQHLIR